MNEKYPLVRIPKELYDDIKRHADRKETSIGDMIQFAWNSLKPYRKAEIPNVAVLKEKMEKNYIEKLNEMKRQLEKEYSEKYEQKIREAKEINEEIALHNQELIEELKKYESERDVNQILKARIDELENELKIKDKEIAEQSQDKLSEENQYLKTQIGKKDMEIEAKNKRIGEIENLLKTAKLEKEEMINTILKIIRDCKEYLPSMNEHCKLCVEGYSIEQYGKSVLKSIINLEGYINSLRS
jgi:chromosome segregation ATPase